MENIGIIGTGNMGKGIAKNLVKSGYHVEAYKRNLEKDGAKVEELKSFGIVVTGDMKKVFAESEILILCLPDSDVIKEIITGKNGLIYQDNYSVKYIIDFSSALPAVTKKLSHTLKKKGISMLDTPMSGGPKQAAEGQLVLVVGGDKEVYDKMKPLLEKVSSYNQYAGESGTGHLIKLINNYIAILTTYSTSTAYLLCKEYGLDPKTLYTFINNSGARSPVFKGQMETIMNGEFPTNFYLHLACKDLGYMLDTFQKLGLKNEVLEQLHNEYTGAAKSGYNDKAVSEIYNYYKEKNS